MVLGFEPKIKFQIGIKCRLNPKTPFIPPLLFIGHTGTHLLIPVIKRSSDNLSYCEDTGWFTALLNLLTGLITLVRKQERFV